MRTSRFRGTFRVFLVIPLHNRENRRGDAKKEEARAGNLRWGYVPAVRQHRGTGAKSCWRASLKHCGPIASNRFLSPTNYLLSPRGDAVLCTKRAWTVKKKKTKKNAHV